MKTNKRVHCSLQCWYSKIPSGYSRRMRFIQIIAIQNDIANVETAHIYIFMDYFEMSSNSNDQIHLVTC